MSSFDRLSFTIGLGAYALIISLVGVLFNMPLLQWAIMSLLMFVMLTTFLQASVHVRRGNGRQAMPWFAVTAVLFWAGLTYAGMQVGGRGPLIEALLNAALAAFVRTIVMAVIVAIVIFLLAMFFPRGGNKESS